MRPLGPGASAGPHPCARPTSQESARPARRRDSHQGPRPVEGLPGALALDTLNCPPCLTGEHAVSPHKCHRTQTLSHPSPRQDARREGTPLGLRGLMDKTQRRRKESPVSCKGPTSGGKDCASHCSVSRLTVISLAHYAPNGPARTGAAHPGCKAASSQGCISQSRSDHLGHLRQVHQTVAEAALKHSRKSFGASAVEHQDTACDARISRGCLPSPSLSTCC